MDMLAPDLTIQVTSRPCSCVLDPALALSRYGVPLSCGLGRVMEVWMVPEFFHILDNTFFYLDRPELLMPIARTGQPADPGATTRVLRQWERLRGETDLVRQSLKWVGDALRDSSLPDGADIDLPWRWEQLAQAFDHRIASEGQPNPPFYAATRDAAALSVALPAAGILTFRCALTRGNGSDDGPPAICELLDHFGLPCCRVLPLDEIASLEREVYRHLVVRAGLAKYLWSGLDLVVLHLVAPEASQFIARRQTESGIEEVVISESTASSPSDPWENAHGWWYPI
jgi:hypothetical protein